MPVLRLPAETPALLGQFELEYSEESVHAGAARRQDAGAAAGRGRVAESGHRAAGAGAEGRAAQDRSRLPGAGGLDPSCRRPRPPKMRVEWARLVVSLEPLTDGVDSPRVVDLYPSPVDERNRAQAGGGAEAIAGAGGRVDVGRRSAL